MIYVVLYKQGPPFYHASYSVIVKLVDSDSTADFSTSWTSLAALNRITQHVAKVMPATAATHFCTTPASLIFGFPVLALGAIVLSYNRPDTFPGRML